MSTDTLLNAARSAEAAIGENLVWLSDALDLRIRQRDAETLRRLAQLNDAWIQLCKALPR
jgi:hypothetical protein